MSDGPRSTSWSQASSAILLREAARSSRRWQTYASRTAFSGVLLGVLLLGIWAAVSATRATGATGAVDTANLAWLGRMLFVAFSAVQTLLALVLAPLSTASAITEETDERTLEMLVLTRLRAPQILAAKILSRILVLVTVVAGALPVTALVVNLGGVSTVEIVAVTVHTLTTVVVMAILGAFFALFTRSPTLATVASAAYAFPFFGLLPGVYVLFAGGDAGAMAHFSTFAAAAATDWTALLPPVSFLPPMALTMALATPLFQQRVSSASIQKAFSETIWRSGRFGLVLVGWMLTGTFTLPWMAPILWSAASSPWVDPLRAFVWAWFVFGATLGTWVYLRVGMDVVDGIDAVFAGTQTVGGDRVRLSRPVTGSPVWWREARFRAWTSTALPMLVLWVFLLLGVFQTGWWVIPGGMLSIGLVNAAGSIALASWLATRSIAEERRRGTLEVLLSTTLPSWEIILGKAASALLPTAPMMALSGLLLALGVPQLELWGFGRGASPESLAEAGLRGLLLFCWAVPIWLFAVVASMAIAVRTERSSSAFVVVTVGLLGFFGLPTVLARIFPGTWAELLARAIAPPLAGDFGVVLVGASILAMTCATASVAVLLVQRLRPWVGALGLLLAAAALAPGAAEAAPSPEEIERMERLFRLRLTPRPMLDGFVRNGLPTSVWIGLENAGDDTEGVVRLSAPSLDGTGGTRAFERAVSLPATSRKEIQLELTGTAGGEVAFTYAGTDGRQAVGVAKLQVLDVDAVLLGVVGRDALGLPALLRDATEDAVPARAFRPRASTPRPVRTGLVDLPQLPRHSAAWASVDELVWPDADPSGAEQAQLEALRGYVLDGGHLVVTVSDTWRQVAGSPLAELLPVTLSAPVAADPWPLLGALGLGGTPGATSVIGAGGEPVPGAIVRASDADGRPLWVTRAYGTGTVSVLLADLDAPAFAGLDAGAMRRLLTLPAPGGAATDLLATTPAGDTIARWFHLEPVVGTDPAAWEAEVRARLGAIPGVAPLPLEWLVIFAGAYLLVIGPLDYLLLRLLGRQPLTWVTFPVWIAVFSGVALSLLQASKGSRSVLVRIEVEDRFPDTGHARGSTWLALFSVGKGRVAVESELPDARLVPLDDPGYMVDPVQHTSDAGGMLSWHAETWTLAYLRSDWARPAPGGVALDGAQLVSTLDFDLVEAAIVGPSGVGTVGAPIGVGKIRGGGAVLLPETVQPPVGERLAFAIETFAESMPASRGALDAEHQPVLIGIAELPIEPLGLRGVHPTESAFRIVRIPLPGFVMPAEEVQGVVEVTSEDGAALQLRADWGCEKTRFVQLDRGHWRSGPAQEGCTVTISDPTTFAETQLTPLPGQRYRCTAGTSVSCRPE